jgi:hypothetical protein
VLVLDEIVSTVGLAGERASSGGLEAEHAAGVPCGKGGSAGR